MTFFQTHKWQLILLIIITLIAYCNIYQNDFISDDIAGIVTNKNAQDMVYSLKTLNPSYIIRSINFQIGKYDPAIYHLTSVLFHIANSILVYICIILLPFWKKDLKELSEKEKKKATWIALLTASLFAIHPIETESVTWISGGGYLFFTFFLLVSLVFFLIYLVNLKSKPVKKYRWMFISGLFYFLALLTSLKAIFFPGLIFALLLVHPAFPLTNSKNLRKYIPSLCMVIVVSFFFMATILSGVQTRTEYISNLSGRQITMDNMIFQIIVAIGSYIKLMFLPFNLTLYHSEIISNVVFWIYAGIVGILGIGILVSIKKSPIVFFALSWFILALSPNLIVINLAWTVAERYVYMGSIGFFLCFSYILYRIKEKAKIPEVIDGIVISIICILIPLTLIRNAQWKNADTFWPVTLEKSPNSSQAHMNMGDYYTRHNNPNEAIKEFTMAINLENGRYPAAIHNLATVYLNVNETTTAAKLYEKAISQNPNLIESFAQLALIYLKQNDLVRAKEYCLKMIQLNPEYAPAYEFLGIVLNAKGNKKEALINLKKAISLDPENGNYQRNLEILQ
jgi:protein O-mannosyl-transferase